MTPTERDELAAAIREHFPGLPDGAVDWCPGVAYLHIGRIKIAVRREGPDWLARELTGHDPGDVCRPSADAILSAVRAYFVYALATARADVAAYERALGGES